MWRLALLSVYQRCPPTPAHHPSLNLQTHVHAAPLRVMDLSRSAPLSESNKAFHACSLHLLGAGSIKSTPRCQFLLTSRPGGHSYQCYVYAHCQGKTSPFTFLKDKNKVIDIDALVEKDRKTDVMREKCYVTQGSRDSDRQQTFKTNPTTMDLQQPFFVCAGSQLQHGGGQIVTTGAPQQFSLSKWKPVPTHIHHFILELPFIWA